MSYETREDAREWAEGISLIASFQPPALRSRTLFPRRFWRTYRYLRGRFDGPYMPSIYRDRPKPRRAALRSAWCYARKGASA